MASSREKPKKPLRNSEKEYRCSLELQGKDKQSWEGISTVALHTQRTAPCAMEYFI